MLIILSFFCKKTSYLLGKSMSKFQNLICTYFMALLTFNTFFCAFSKIPTKRKFVRLLFLKLNQFRNTRNIFWGGFLQKSKTHFFGGPKWYRYLLFKSQFLHCISAFVLYCKRKLHANFHQKIFFKTV